MENQQEEEPKLTYEQVRQIIRERIDLINKNIANASTDSKAIEKERKRSLWQWIKSIFSS